MRALVVALVAAGALAAAWNPRQPAIPPAPPPAWFLALRPGDAPRGLPGLTTRKLTLAGETRNAFVAPRDLDWPLRVAAGAEVELAAGLRCAEGSTCRGAVTFEARAEGGGAPLARFRLEAGWREDRPESLPIQGPATRWQVVRVPLGAVVGRALRLRLRATPDAAERAPDGAERPTPFWAEPRLFAPHPARPNVLLVSIDTLRADRLGSAGYARPVSPHLDRLAREGLRFSQAVTPAPWTTPAHMSLFTGVYPSTHRVTTRPEVTPVRRLAAGLPTLAELLRAQGFATHAWTGGGTIGASYGFDRGFDVYEEGALKATPAARADVVARLRGLAGAPFFLFVHTFEAHAPYTRTRFVLPRLTPAARADWDLRFDLEWRQRPGRRALDPAAPYEGPAGRLAPEALARRQALLGEGVEGLLRRHGLWDAAVASALYDGGVAEADAFVGELLAELDALGLRERTLVVVTSDHGEEFGEHDPGRFWDAHCVTLFDELLRVPLILRLPGGPRGEVAAPASLVDVAPTLLDALGLPAPAMQGRSLLPVARGRADAAREPLLAEATCSGPELKALRSPDVKYVAEFQAGHDDGVPLDPHAEQLFDLARDPGERRDRAPHEPARAQALRRELLARVRALRGAARVGDEGALDAEALERLRALGYVR